MMKSIVLIVFCLITCGDAELRKISRDVSDGEKSSPLMWLIVRQLAGVESRLTQLQNNNFKDPTCCSSMEKKVNAFEQNMQSISNLTSKMKQLRNDLLGVITKEGQTRKQIHDYSIKISSLDKTDTYMLSELRLLKDEIKEYYLNCSNILNQLKKEPLVQKAQCEDGWEYLNGHCYFSSPVTKNWTDAKNDCLARKAYLVKVDNKEENDWLKTKVNQNTWIGAHDSQVEGQWRWVSDNTIVSFTDWGKSEPNNYINEDCAHFYKTADLLWNDTNCGGAFFYFCERNFTH